MRGEGLTRHLLAGLIVEKVGETLCFHSCRVHHQRGTVFLQRIQLAAVNPGIGIRCAPDFAFHTLVIGQRISVGPKQGFARFIFQLPLIGFCPTLTEIALPIVDVKPRDHAIAIKGDVIVGARWELRIRLNTVEGAIEFGGDGAFIGQVRNIGFDAGRRIEAREGRGLWELCHGATSRLCL